MPVGYGDGVRRALTNDCDVLVGGRRVPLVGHGLDGQRHRRPRARSRRSAAREAVLIGAQGAERVLAEEWARRLGTINYEITCGISARVPREHHRVSGGVSAPTPLEAAREVLAGREAWLVGGAVRDRLLGRATTDLDLAVPDDPDGAPRARSRAPTGGAAFRLSGAFGAWRVVGPGHAWHVDLVTLRDGDIDADLAARDFTVNAMAEPLAGGELLDPHGGRADLEARRLRMVSARRARRRPAAHAARGPHRGRARAARSSPATAAAIGREAPGLERRRGRARLRRAQAGRLRPGRARRAAR